MQSRFVLRRRARLRADLRYYGALLLTAASLLAAGFGPLVLGWWDSVAPAALGGAIAAVLLFAVAVNAPLEAFPCVSLYFDSHRPAASPRGFGGALYRHSERLDASAREAGLAPLTEFESADPLDTKEAPVWHEPRAALPTVRHLLTRAEPALRPHLDYLRSVLEEADARGAKFYFLVGTMAGGTNARVESVRHGDLSILR